MKHVFVVTVSDILTGAFIALCVIAGALLCVIAGELLGLRAAIKQAFCEHKDYHEPTIYHGYACRNCGKDFGYTRPGA